MKRFLTQLFTGLKRSNKASAVALLAILAAGVAGGCGKKAVSQTPVADSGDASVKTSPSIAGTYIITAFEMSGRDMPKSKDRPDEVVKITSDTISQVTNTGRLDVKKYTLDPTKNPPQIDLVETENGKTKTHYGIYKQEGNTLLIIIAGEIDMTSKDAKGKVTYKFRSPEPEDRPKEFKGRTNSFDYMMTLERKK